MWGVTRNRAITQGWGVTISRPKETSGQKDCQNLEGKCLLGLVKFLCPREINTLVYSSVHSDLLEQTQPETRGLGELLMWSTTSCTTWQGIDTWTLALGEADEDTWHDNVL